MLEIGKYLTRQREVEAVRITVDNMDEVSKWCNGEIVKPQDSAETWYIQARTFRPMNKRQSEGHVDDWVVKQGKNFKIYMHEPFKFGFEQARGAIQNTPLDLPYAPGAQNEKTPIFQELSTSDRKELRQTLPPQGLTHNPAVPRNLVGMPKPPLPKIPERLAASAEYDPKLQFDPPKNPNEAEDAEFNGPVKS